MGLSEGSDVNPEFLFYQEDMIVYKIVKSLFHVALIAVCVSMPLTASAGVGTEPSAVGPSDPTSSTTPLMTAPLAPGTDTQTMAMPMMAAPMPESQNTAASRAITPDYPAPSFQADMLVAQNFDPYLNNGSPSAVDPSAMLSPQQYTTPQYPTAQYPAPMDMGQYPQYNSPMAIPPYPSQNVQQPYLQGTFSEGMMPYGQQGMSPQMPGMGMSPYGAQPQYLSVEQLYNQAMQSYKARDYQSAMMGFQEVSMRFPQSDLADNAYYWIGEIYYNTKNYPAAIQSFQTVMQMYPQGNKVPDAMVKMGFAYADIGQYNVARTILNDVSMRFSGNARIRNLAVKKLNSLNNLY
jgi:tol-pal system protein YbgF